MQAAALMEMTKKELGRELEARGAPKTARDKKTLRLRSARADDPRRPRRAARGGGRVVEVSQCTQGPKGGPAFTVLSRL